MVESRGTVRSLQSMKNPCQLRRTTRHPKFCTCRLGTPGPHRHRPPAHTRSTRSASPDTPLAWVCVGRRGGCAHRPGLSAARASTEAASAREDRRPRGLLRVSSSVPRALALVALREGLQQPVLVQRGAGAACGPRQALGVPLPAELALEPRLDSGAAVAVWRGLVARAPLEAEELPQLGPDVCARGEAREQRQQPRQRLAVAKGGAVAVSGAR